MFIESNRMAYGLGVWSGLLLHAFRNLDEEDRQQIMELVKKRDQELILEKLGR